MNKKIGPLKIHTGWGDFIHIFFFDYTIFNFIRHKSKDDGVYYFCFRFFNNHGLSAIKNKSYFNQFIDELDGEKVKSFLLFGWKIRLL